MIINYDKFGYPVKHRRKVPFNPTIRIPPEITEWSVEILRLDAELERYILSRDDLVDLIIEAFSSNIHISTRLEGNPLTLNDVRRLTKGAFTKGISENERDFPSQEIINHILCYTAPEFGKKLSIYDIKNMHRFLMIGSNQVNFGEFRDHPSVIESSTGQELFIPAPHEYIEEELNSLLAWVNETGPSLYPVIAGSILFHEFESIHPFTDGNGRCGRSLFHIYLQTHGLPNSKLCFIEQNIVSDPEYYYELLARTDHTGDLKQLIVHFTKSVLKSYRDAVKRYREKDLMSSDLDETSKRLLLQAKRAGSWFDLAQTRNWVDNVSDYRIRNRLNNLISRGALEEKGSTRSKKYRYSDPLNEILKRQM